MLSLVAVEGDLADRAVGTCHDTVTTAQKMRRVSSGAVSKIPITSPKTVVTLKFELAVTAKSILRKLMLSEEWRLGKLLPVEPWYHQYLGRRKCRTSIAKRRYNVEAPRTLSQDRLKH
jgi:hypothetical protein